MIYLKMNYLLNPFATALHQRTPSLQLVHLPYAIIPINVTVNLYIYIGFNEQEIPEFYHISMH